MSAKALKMLEDLELDLDMLDFTDLVGRVKEIRRLLTPAPKKIKPKPKTQERIKLHITEGNVKSTIVFDTEKETEKFLKFKQKERKLKLDLLFKSEGLYPISQLYRDRNYAELVENHTSKIKAAGLNFELIIEKL